MARPEKNTFKYFPHEVNHGKKMHFIEKKYKNDGYAVWHKLLEELGKSEFHYLNISEEVTMMFLSSSFNVSEDLLREIIGDLVKLEVFDKELFASGILFNQKFNDSIEDAYKKRSNSIITKNQLLLHLTAKGILKPSISTRKPSKSGSEVPVNPQSRLDYTKEEESTYSFFISEFNKVRQSSFKDKDKKTEQKYYSRIKDGYSVNDILNATKEAMKEAYHIETNFKYLTPEFMTRPDKLERFSQSIPRQEAIVQEIIDLTKMSPNEAHRWKRLNDPDYLTRSVTAKFNQDALTEDQVKSGKFDEFYGPDGRYKFFD